MKRLAVIGAGPCGLAAALGGVRRGFDVTVLERDDVGASLRRWGPTRLFSPLAMNLPPGTADLIPLPPGDALLTGAELVDAVLTPLAASAPLAGRIRRGHAVVAVGRARMSRGELPGHPVRAERPFRLLLDTPEGERELEADAVLDATGVGLPTALGAGGLPARGERTVAARVIRGLGELHERRRALAGRRLLLIGHGHSAANALHQLAAVAAEAPATRVTWAVRTANLRPCVEVASDPLPERQHVVGGANALAARPPTWLKVERRAHVQALVATADALRVELSGDRTAEVDDVVAMTGFRPDPTLHGELAVNLSPVSEGAGGIHRRLANITDCLSVPSLSPADLASGEPGFHLIGARSYGRARTFLLQTGYAQIETILDGL